MAVVRPSQKLMWDYPFPLMIDGFRVYAAKIGAMGVPEDPVKVWENNDRNVTQASVGAMNLENGEEYRVTCTAYLGSDESDMSAAVNFTYMEMVNAPTNLRII